MRAGGVRAGGLILGRPVEAEPVIRSVRPRQVRFRPVILLRRGTDIVVQPAQALDESGRGIRVLGLPRQGSRLPCQRAESVVRHGPVLRHDVDADRRTLT